MGPTMARMACRARGGAGVLAVSRFSSADAREALEACGVRTLACDLLERRAVEALPDAGAVLFMAGTKFGTAADPATTWAQNAWMPGIVAERYAGVPTVAFSSGNVYPLVPVDGPGADESTPPAPVGEYGRSVLARERAFEHFSRSAGTPVVLLRLNYATELRYGVLVDVALAVRDGRPIDLAMGHVDVIWQGDANRFALRALSLCASPPRILNVTGNERVSIRELAGRFGDLLGREPILEGRERDTALLSDASAARAAFGEVEVPLERMVEWTARWVGAGGPTAGVPTRYEVRDGTF